MGRILAIDYGQKRVGLAVTDPNKILATALDTVSVAHIFEYLTQYLSRENVELIIVGEPKQMDFTNSEASRYIDPFVKRLEKSFASIPIVRVDERFTSKMAFQTMIDAGTGKKNRQNKALIDKISATIMLQSYLQQIEIENNRKK